MILARKIILLSFILLHIADVLPAQQNSSALPSLINGQTNHIQANDSGIEAALKQKMFIKVVTNKNKIFVGEPFMATYKFYVSMRVNDQPSVLKQPEFSGCSVKELDFEQAPDIEMVSNETYAVYIVRKVQLTPLQPGLLSLGKAYVSNNIRLTDPDNPYATKKYNITINNGDAAVEVNELPQKNKPAGFYGITGAFNISASATDNKIPVGENGHLIVTIKGSGNLDAINKPDISWPDNTEHFDGNDSQHISQGNFPVSGDRIFDIPFIGKKEGAVLIPSIQFSFFNTASKSYQTVSTNAIPITFTKALTKKDQFTNIVNYDITNRKYLWIVPAIAVVVALIGFISYKRNKERLQKTMPVITSTVAPVFAEPQPTFAVKYRTDFSYYLNELENEREAKKFFSKAKEILTKAVAERIDSNQYSEEILLSELKAKTYNAPLCNKVAALYEAINLNLYAPFEIQADLPFYLNELKTTVQALQAEG